MSKEVIKSFLKPALSAGIIEEKFEEEEGEGEDLEDEIDLEEDPL